MKIDGQMLFAPTDDKHILIVHQANVICPYGGQTHSDCSWANVICPYG
jgi:hypothetical protein